MHMCTSEPETVPQILLTLSLFLPQADTHAAPLGYVVTVEAFGEIPEPLRSLPDVRPGLPGAAAVSQVGVASFPSASATRAAASLSKTPRISGRYPDASTISQNS